MEHTIERMNRQERFQHMVMFLTFTALAITGFLVFLPENYVAFLGSSAERVFAWRSLIHRIAGALMIAVSAYHLAYLAFTPRGRWQFRELLPRWKDWQDVCQMFRHFMKPETPLPKFGWFNYVEKAEYWALVWGTVVMNLTGLLLWFETLAPKIILDIATVIHRYEAILAVLSIIVWHFYHVHWKPGVFPMSPVWLTGQISEEESRHHHPLAYEKMMQERKSRPDEF